MDVAHLHHVGKVYSGRIEPSWNGRIRRSVARLLLGRFLEVASVN